MIRNNAIINIYKNDVIITTILVEEDYYTEAIELIESIDLTDETLSNLNNVLYKMFEENNLKIEIPFINEDLKL